MKLQHPITRLGVSLAALGLISSIIPLQGGTAFAQNDSYLNDSTNGGSKGVVQGAVIGLVGYGLYGALRGAGRVSGSVVPTVTTAPSMGAPVTGSTGAGTIPVNTNPVSAMRASVEDPIYDTLAGQDDVFSTIHQGIAAASNQEKGPNDLVRLLRKEGPYTVFAPTNSGFNAALPAGVLAKLFSVGSDLPFTEKIAARAKIRGVLAGHIVSGRYTIGDLKKLPSGTVLKTLSGSDLKITTEGGLKVNGVKVIESDIPATNGLIHPLEGVLGSIN